MEARLRSLDIRDVRVSDQSVFVGTNSGIVTINNNARPSAAEEQYIAFKNEPVFEIPFDRDLAFIRRDDIVSRIDQTLKTHHRAALSGIGGVGSATRFIQAYTEFAASFALPGWNDPTVDTLQLVATAISRDRRKWLIVLDNADDREALFSDFVLNSATKPLVAYIPRGIHVSILITTRNEQLGQDLANGVVSVPVLPMESFQAKALLQSNLKGITHNEEDLSRFVADMDYLPLAITQAAAFMTRNKITLEKYMTKYYANVKSLQDLLDSDHYDYKRDFGSSSSVIKTWKISFDQIARDQPKSAELLSLMAMLDRQGIPEMLLRSENDNETEFVTAIGILLAFSLIAKEKERDSYGMHRLVQLSTQRWLELEGSIKTWRTNALELVSKKFPFGSYTNRAVCQTLQPHATLVLQGGSELDELSYANLLHNSSGYDMWQGKYDKAAVGFFEAESVRSRKLGKEDPSTLDSASALAWILSAQGNYEKAESLNRHTLEIYEKTLGIDHPDTLSSVGNLASVLSSQGKYSEAEVLHRRALEYREKTLGTDHPNTLISVGNLGLVLSNQGKYNEAERLSRRVLEGYEKTLGEDHPDTLTGVNNLASTLMKQGKYIEAERLSRRALEGHEKTLGMDHPDTLVDVNNVSGVLSLLGKYSEAEDLGRRALEGREKALGTNHPDTLVSVNSLAFVLSRQGKYLEAESLNRRALEGREKTLGTDHPDTLVSVSNLASMLSRQGKYHEAEGLSRRALEGREKTLGMDHPSTLVSVGNLASALLNQGKYNEAEGLGRRALEDRQKSLGTDHPATLISMTNLAELLKRQGRLEETKKLFLQVLELQETKLGEHHPDTISSLTGLAYTLNNLGNETEAVRLMTRAVGLSKTTLGDEHPNTISRDRTLREWLDRIQVKDSSQSGEL